ncbi:MAG: HEPN domain-containing protein [Thermodesulfobacteriota bacterium]
MKETVERWLRFADEDLKMAKLAFKEGMYNQVCFHAQQCVEKLLKGFIQFKDKVHPQSHKLADLLSSISESPFDELRGDILLLDRFYIPTRYPDALPGSLSEGLPTEEDAKEAMAVAQAVLRNVRGEMK